MTPTIRSIVVLTGCYLASACSEPAETSSAAKTKQSQPVVTAPMDDGHKAALEQKTQLEALTAVSPSMPSSLADAPPPSKKPEELPTMEVSATAETSTGEVVTPIEHEDFDRPLDPKSVKIDRFVLAEKVEGREPVGESEVFSSDTKEIFAFVQLANDKEPPYAFTVHWEPAEGPASPYGVKLTVPTASRWRTWSWTRIKREPGHYKAVLRTVDGEEIASKDFEVVPAATAQETK
ncbi:MAG: hypothetical protein RLZZ450_2909 [Pseudomonadota bacterium]|jgi:hypothetical protein